MIDAPPLLMLPGTLCDARVFAPMLGAMAGMGAGHGHPHFGAMDGAASAEALADAILDTAPARFVPVGFSLGAIVALEIALRAPDRVPAMVLIAANPRAVPTADWPARRAAARLDPGHLVGDVLWPRSVAPAARDNTLLRGEVMAMARDAVPGTLARQIEVAITRREKRGALAALTMPALLLCGAHDAITPPSLSGEIAAEMPLAHVKIIADAGHFLPLEQPQACARALAAWLADTFPRQPVGAGDGSLPPLS